MSHKELELEFRDVLMNIFNDSPKVREWENVSVHAYNYTDAGKTPRHNYERGLIEYQKKKRINYQNRKLALIRVKPHKEITVFSFYDHDRYAQKLFERVVRMYLPEAKLVTVDNE